MKRSKLDWMKDLRGADLTNAEFRVLVTLLGYSDRHRNNAHPGRERLAMDTRLSRSGVVKALAGLESKGWILKTEQGGNQYGKGTANKYSIHTPADIHKGPLSNPPAASTSGREGATFETKGSLSSPSRGHSEDMKGSPEWPPSGHSSGPSSIRSSSIHSERTLSGAASPREPAPTYPYDEDTSDEIWEWIEDELGDLDGPESSTVLGMLEADCNPRAIVNTINARRTA